LTGGFPFGKLMFNQTIFQKLSNLPLRPPRPSDFALKHPFNPIFRLNKHLARIEDAVRVEDFLGIQFGNKIFN
jgi:hypothetical protein